jgi:hydroxyacylglutathione hydrolase
MKAIRKLLLDGEIPVNCYIVERDRQCYIIDPGYQKEKIQKYISDNELNVRGILLTHAHIDHIEALDCFSVPIYLHELEYNILMDNYCNGFDYFGKPTPYDLNELNIQLINSKTTFTLDNEFIYVIHTPGHTVGSVCYKFGHDIYTGDTLFEASVGKWDRPTGNLPQLKETILNLINNQPDYMIIHPGHGRNSTIGIEKKINQFYRQWSLEQSVKL